MEVLAIDIGGTSVKHAVATVRAGLSSPQLAGVERAALPSLDFEDLRKVVRGVVKARAANVCAIGISTSGSVDREGKVISAGHFSGYADVVWRDELNVDDDVPVVVVNDGRAAAWGEYSTGDRRAETHVHVVLGTGVGGGIVHRGELLLGDSGQAGYIGHIRVTDTKTLDCSCGRRGHVEALASERGICHIFAEERGVAHSESAPASLREVFEMSIEDDGALRRTLARAGWGLGAGLGAVLNVLNPGAVTIGGGVVLALRDAPQNSYGSADALLAGVTDGMQETAHKRPFAAVECEWGKLGNDAGIVGAALLAAASADRQ